VRKNMIAETQQRPSASWLSDEAHDCLFRDLCTSARTRAASKDGHHPWGNNILADEVSMEKPVYIVYQKCLGSWYCKDQQTSTTYLQIDLRQEPA
jgi:hypothetical protein